VKKTTQTAPKRKSDRKENGQVLHPKMLPPPEYQALLSEWVVQCWMPKNKVPTTSAAAKSFNFHDLEVEFQKRYVAGDWRRIVSGRGVTIREFALYLRLKTKGMVAVAIDEQKASSFDLTGIETIRVSRILLAMCLVRHLKAFRPGDTVAGKIGIPMMVIDGAVGHVVTARSADETGMLIGYDEDPTRKGSNSFLCSGQNAIGRTAAQYYGNDVVGEWVISVPMLSLLLLAIPIEEAVIPLWRKWAALGRNELDRAGAEFPLPWEARTARLGGKP
jgi:hypothetical protein